MQGRIIGALKDVWQTLKKEIKGPQIKGLSDDKKKPEIGSLELKSGIEIKIQKINDNVSVFNMNDNMKIDIITGIFEHKEYGVKLLRDIFKISGRNIAITNDKIKVNRLDKEKFIVSIKRFDIGRLKTRIFSQRLSTFPVIRDGKERILKVPRKIKGKIENNMGRGEYSAFENKLKSKLPRRDINNYRIEAVFKGLPLKNIKNIIYFHDKMEIELYYKNTEVKSIETVDFIIARNRTTGLIEKYFA